MSTFAIDLLSGKEYLFNEDFTNSGMTTFSGVTSAINGLTIVGTGGHTVRFGGTLNSGTTIIRGAGNTAGIEYGGDYSADFSARSLVDKGYVDKEISENTQNTSIQLVDNTGDIEVNTIIPTPIVWTLQEYVGDDISWTGGSRIYATETGNYKISYTLNVVNQTNSVKIIGSQIRRNGNTLVTQLTSTSYAINTINDTGTNVMPLFAISLNAGDYIELIAFRVGAGDGSVLTVSSGSWIRMEETD
jgi:hypothetical protein